MAAGQRYWFAHPAGKSRSLWPVSWQGMIVVMLGGAAAALPIGLSIVLDRHVGWPAALAVAGAVALAVSGGLHVITRRKCDPVRPAEDYQADERERARVRNLRVMRRVGAARQAVRRRREIIE